MVIFWLELRQNPKTTGDVEIQVYNYIRRFTSEELEILPWHQYSIHPTKPAMLISLMDLIISPSITKWTDIKFYPPALNLFGRRLLHVFNCIRSPPAKINRINHS